MDDANQKSSEANAADEVGARVDAEGVSVRKTADPHGDNAVAVYLRIRSDRQTDCAVRVADTIPEPLRDHVVEFHPRYDPGNWTRADEAVVYNATVAPESRRTSAYGITVDDPHQVRLFTAEPSVEVSPVASRAETAEPHPGDTHAFAFGPDAEPLEDQPPGSNPLGEVAVSRTTGDTVVAEGTGRDDDEATSDGAAGDDPVEALVATIRRRGLTDRERRVLEGVLDADRQDAGDTALESVRADLETLEAALATVDRRTAGIEALERRVESLAADVESLEAALDRETRWRAQLQDSLRTDPGPE